MKVDDALYSTEVFAF